MDNLHRLLHLLGQRIDEAMSIRQLAKETNTPYTSALRTINNNKELFTMRTIGKAKSITINKEDDIVKHHLIIAERAATREAIKKQPFLKSIEHDLKTGTYTVLLFGSRATKDYRERSDVDLCTIGAQKMSFNKLEMLTGKEINTMQFTEEEFKEMIKSKEHNIGKEIMRKHLVLKGEEHYWEMIWHAL